ncbi:MAG TPA: phosphatase PAP2 family protein [Cellulomonadaceae bacterium]|nr:phosphatase PAP2 family protein [Cellulomonadaceae bacterium]
MNVLDRATSWWRAHPQWRAAAPGLVVMLVGLLGFVALLDSVQEHDDVTVLDQPVLSWLVAHRSTVMTAVFGAVTLVSGPVVLPVLVAVGCVTWGLVSRSWWRPGLLAIAMIVSTLVSLAVKSSVARPRPPAVDMVVPGAETTFSFPSGHTIGAATLVLTLGYLLLARRMTAARALCWSAAAVVWVGAVGLSRLYLGYHFLTDVAAAVALALITVGSLAALDQGRGRRSRCPQQDSNLQPTD